ncbi:MAG: transcriptional regulator [Gemmatimonadetes bacterium]|nr:MAG: transcriptional regulator [Gemmatimonadota bacterium]
MTMRFMTIVKTRETGARPSPELIDRIMKLGEEAAGQGKMVGMGGLAPTALGARARLANGKITVTDGPFSEAKEVFGGFAIYDVASKKEALEWTRRFLEAHIGLWDQDLEVEVRQMMDEPSKGC